MTTQSFKKSKKKFSHFSLSFFIPLSLFLFNCVPDNPAGSGATEDNDKVGGTLCNSSGKPIASTLVYLIPSNAVPSPGGLNQQDIFSARTDSNGHFSFACVEPGVFNMLAVKNEEGLYHDSITINDNDKVRITDTLCPLGSVTGQVMLLGGDDARTVLIFGIGTMACTYPVNATGIFTLKDMAPGTYYIRFLSTIDTYLPLDTMLVVKPGIHDTLTSPVVLPWNGVPVVTEVIAHWNNMLLQTELSWKPLDTAKVNGYNVYRCIAGEQPNDQPINGAYLIRPALYCDTTCALGNQYTYYVKAVDKKGVTSPAFSAPQSISATSAYHLVRTITMPILSSNDFTPMSVKNGEIFLVSETGQNSWCHSQIMILDSTGAKVDSMGFSGPGRLFRPWNIKADDSNIYIGDVCTDKITDTSNIDPIIKFPLANIKVFSRSGVLIDSIYMNRILADPGPSQGGDFVMTSSQSYYFTNGIYITNTNQTGVTEDSVPFPLKKEITFYPEIELFKNTIITANGVYNMTLDTGIGQLAILDAATLSVSSLFDFSWHFHAFTVDDSGLLYLVHDKSRVTILSRIFEVVGKVYLPTALYRDISVDTDGLIYIYDYQNQKILVYRK